MNKTEHKLPPLHRQAVIEHIAFRADDDASDSRQVRLAFSSELPVKRWFGGEILDHSPASVRMDWFKGGTAPLLLDHDPTRQIGVVEVAEIGNDRVGRATVRFGKSAQAEEILQDVRDGIRANISVGYRIHRAVREEMNGEDETYRVNDWEPFEISIVSVPADQTVGVGRADSDATNVAIFETLNRSEPDMTTEPNKQATTPAPAAVAAAADVDVDKLQNDVRAAERSRIGEIMALATRHNMRDIAEKAIKDGTSIENFRGIVLERIGDDTPLDNGPADLGISNREVQEYSFLRAINAAASKDWSKAGFELECSRTIAETLGQEPRGFFIPTDVQRARFTDGQRDLSVGTDTAGGNLVGTMHMGSSFIEVLRNAMMVRRMGARVLSGLRGNVNIPSQTAAGAATWISAEDGDATETNQTFGQVSLSVKTIAAFTEMTRNLLLQSDPSVEQLVRLDLAMAIALGIDLAAINGSGSNGQPTGILQTSGIGNVAGGTNGAAPTWANIVNIWREVAIDNADFGSTGWLINAATVGKLATTEKAANTAKFIIDGLPGPDGMVPGGLAGQRCGVSNQVPSNLTKGTASGVCSALIYGNWSDVLIGEWGVLDVLVDPFTAAAKGKVALRVFQSVDVALRRPQSFSAMKDALTA